MRAVTWSPHRRRSSGRRGGAGSRVRQSSQGLGELMSGGDPRTSGSDDRPATESSAEDGSVDHPESTEESSGDHSEPSPKARPARGRPRQIRRVPKPRMTGLLDSPGRNLTVGVTFVIIVMILATAATWP